MIVLSGPRFRLFIHTSGVEIDRLVGSQRRFVLQNLIAKSNSLGDLPGWLSEGHILIAITILIGEVIYLVVKNLVY